MMNNRIFQNYLLQTGEQRFEMECECNKITFILKLRSGKTRISAEPPSLNLGHYVGELEWKTQTSTSWEGLEPAIQALSPNKSIRDGVVLFVKPRGPCFLRNNSFFCKCQQVMYN
jgi:hypothetical protein